MFSWYFLYLGNGTALHVVVSCVPHQAEALLAVWCVLIYQCFDLNLEVKITMIPLASYENTTFVGPFRGFTNANLQTSGHTTLQLKIEVYCLVVGLRGHIGPGPWYVVLKYFNCHSTVLTVQLVKENISYIVSPLLNCIWLNLPIIYI